MFVEVYLFSTTAIKTKFIFKNGKITRIEAMQCSFDQAVENLFSWDLVKSYNDDFIIRSYYEIVLKAYEVALTLTDYNIYLEDFEIISEGYSAPEYRRRHESSI
jgi:hypothetical protein